MTCLHSECKKFETVIVEELTDDHVASQVLVLEDPVFVVLLSSAYLSLMI